jgi:hypothetical protein
MVYAWLWSMHEERTKKEERSGQGKEELVHKPPFQIDVTNSNQKNIFSKKAIILRERTFCVHFCVKNWVRNLVNVYKMLSRKMITFLRETAKLEHFSVKQNSNISP